MKFLFSYSKKWLLYVVSFFVFFAAVLMVSEYIHEKKFRTDALNDELNNYSQLVDGYVSRYNMLTTGNFSGLDSLNSLISKRSLRITVVDPNGKVLYDSQVRNTAGMENHLLRPEIQASLHNSFGTDIRLSSTTRIKYYYYATHYSHFFVRVSVIYDLTARKFIQPDRVFLLFVLLVFFITSFTILLINDKFGKSIRTLREFTLKALANKPIDGDLLFPGNELGVIGQDIIDIYQRLNKTKEELIAEKAKLIRHLNILDEGIAIFSRDKVVITNNNHFLRFLNHISDIRVFSADEFFRIEDFSPLFRFIHKYLNDEQVDLNNYQPTYEITLNKNGKLFSVKSIVFQDRSFEVSVNDITKPANRKLLKQQITENIAHELKTPVSSIKGFLETIIEGNPDKVKTADFLQRAYAQSCRLADLINDISLLTKMEEASNLYQIEPVNVHDLILDITGELEPRFEESGIAFEISVPGNLTLKGNPVLMYSIFRNLFDNAISHGGGNLTIRVENYSEDKEFCYFSFSDNGTGVPEEDLPRLFERFYRVDKGRDRKSGGTGLGLAIVKNAVQFHKGDISVKNRNGGGLEFLFTLAKEGTRDE
jgi:two-component system, OmpR family, phosphate regulon sensor histidine kinase PhoR